MAIVIPFFTWIPFWLSIPIGLVLGFAVDFTTQYDLELFPEKLVLTQDVRREIMKWTEVEDARFQPPEPRWWWPFASRAGEGPGRWVFVVRDRTKPVTLDLDRFSARQAEEISQLVRRYLADAARGGGSLAPAEAGEERAISPVLEDFYRRKW
ncbi:MAG: hypothetical protein JO040_04150 [Gemmatimonadetes bacterium]|nr:hypothetical protein [Gemmatimonadota bacterium]